MGAMLSEYHFVIVRNFVPGTILGVSTDMSIAV